MKRQYETLINEYLSYFPCVVIVGARQTGKSTLIEMVAGDRELFDLEARADYDQIAVDPDLFLRLNNKPIAIDEAQLLPELFPALRVAIDKNRTTYGKYLLSGSSSPVLLDAISESLAGRVGVIEIAPFSYSETNGIDTPKLLDLFAIDCTPNEVLQKWNDSPQVNQAADLAAYWFHGGYPEPWVRGTARFRDTWNEQYVKTYVERDIARLFPGLNTVRFRRFIELLAGCSGAIINYSEIAKILEVSQPTARDYFSIAHGTFLWRTLPAFSKNSRKRLTKHPRGYLRDSGLLHHMLQIPTQRRLLSHPQMGASWEGMVIEEVLRSLNAAALNYSSYYYRTAAGAEVDLVIAGKFGLVPFEIKYVQAVNPRHLRAIRDFVDEFNCAFGIIVNNDEKPRMYDEKLLGVPFSVLTSE
ncbi:MAG: ATP-binding protein [Candidatus Competibacteraceae bacterium]|jgi:predicted AAA+ superfamily ATPase|nr:ATP-binding protein [Candidatus Competibacteraceae bacterium]